MTKCRDKRSIIRALNTFSKQYDFIICNQKELNLSKEPMELLYCDKNELLIFQDEKSNEKQNSIDDKNIIFEQNEALNNLQNTQLLYEAVDNLISINREVELKKDIKEAIKKRENINTGENYFFVKKTESGYKIIDTSDNISISQLEEVLLSHEIKNHSKTIIDKTLFARKLFTQIKNRVMFSRADIYNTINDNAKIMNGKKVIRPKHISYIELMIDDFENIFHMLHLLDTTTEEMVEDRRKVMEEIKSHNGIIEYGIGEDYEEFYTTQEFDSEMLKDSNSTFFHPIDESEYNDPDATQQTRDNNMPNAMYNNEHYNFYDEDIWKDEFAEATIDYDCLIELKHDIGFFEERYGSIINKLVKKTLSFDKVLDKYYSEEMAKKCFAKQKDIIFLLDNIYLLNIFRKYDWEIFTDDEFESLKHIHDLGNQYPIIENENENERYFSYFRKREVCTPVCSGSQSSINHKNKSTLEKKIIVAIRDEDEIPF